LPQRCPQPVEQLPRRPCAAGLTDSRASRASRATRGDAHPARQSAHWQYCTSQHGVAMHPGHCAGRQPACLRTEQGSMLRTLAQRQLASKQALSPLHSRPRAPAAALLNTEAQEPPLVVAALCSAACEQRSARPTPGTPGRLWDGGPPSESSRIGGHVSCRRERAAQRGSVAHAFP
jgi:hypothetical protein